MPKYCPSCHPGTQRGPGWGGKLGDEAILPAALESEAGEGWGIPLRMEERDVRWNPSVRLWARMSGRGFGSAAGWTSTQGQQGWSRETRAKCEVRTRKAGKVPSDAREERGGGRGPGKGDAAEFREEGRPARPRGPRSPLRWGLRGPLDSVPPRGVVSSLKEPSHHAVRRPARGTWGLCDPQPCLSHRPRAVAHAGHVCETSGRLVKGVRDRGPAKGPASWAGRLRTRGLQKYIKRDFTRTSLMAWWLDGDGPLTKKD